MFSHEILRKTQSEEREAKSLMLYTLKTRVSVWLITACVIAVVSFVLLDAFAGAPHLTEVSLYFADAEELKLVVEKRAIGQAVNTVEQVKLTITELIRGPKTVLRPSIPEGTALREVFLDEKGCAYVDFSQSISQNHPGGTTGELVTISSVVNTLTANFPEEIRKVQILIGGREAKTIAGHIDISRPIFPFELE